MNAKPKRAMAFIDGMNLFNHAKSAFGHHYPNYDVKKLFTRICAEKGWEASSVYFYTGIPDSKRDPHRHNFWLNKLRAMQRQGIITFSQKLAYAWDGTREVGREKGVDVKIAVDLICLTYDRAMDVAVIFCQDQDLAEAVRGMKRVAKKQKRFVEIYSAFPVGGKASSGFGIAGSKAIRINAELYDACIDPTDYR